MRFALGLILVLSLSASAVELERVSIDYKYFHPSNRLPEIPTFKAKEGLNLNFDIALLGPLYWRNSIVSITDPGQYRLVGWNFHLGLTVFKSFQVEYEHFSQHLLDYSDSIYPDHKFPVRDSVGFKWNIYSNPAAIKSLF